MRPPTFFFFPFAELPLVRPPAKVTDVALRNPFRNFLLFDSSMARYINAPL